LAIPIHAIEYAFDSPFCGNRINLVKELSPGLAKAFPPRQFGPENRA